jgi:uncharacterized protein (DUF1778 family)
MSIQLKIRLKEEQNKLITTISNQTGLTRQELMCRAFYKPGMPMITQKEIKSLEGQIKKIGNNINQIAKHLNSLHYDPSIAKDLNNSLKDMSEVVKEWRL